MIGNPGLHCGRYAKARVNPAKVVVHKVERNRVLVVLYLL